MWQLGKTKTQLQQLKNVQVIMMVSMHKETTEKEKYVRNPYFVFVNVGTKHFYSGLNTSISLHPQLQWLDKSLELDLKC